MTKRRPRGQRPKSRRYRVMPRDHEILFAVGRMRQATSDQLRQLFFGDPSTASRRLSKLVAIRVLDVNVVHQDEPNVYALGPNAVDVLEAAGLDCSELHRSRLAQGLDPHLRLLNDVRVGFVLATRARRDVQLIAFHSDFDLRRAAGSQPPSYIPDAIAELRTSLGPLTLVIEIDRATMSRPVFLTKVEATLAMWRGGLKCWGAAPDSWRPAVFVPTEGRARSLAKAIVDAGGGALWLVAEFGRLRERGALGPVFALAQEVAAIPRGQSIPYQGALAPSADGRPR